MLKNILLFALLATGILYSPAQADDIYATRVSGTVFTSSGLNVTEGTTFPWGSQIILAPGASADFLDADKIAIKLWGPAQVKLKRSKRDTPWLSLTFGRMIAAFKSGTRAAIGHGASVAGVRGTVVYVEDTEQNPKYTCLCEGKVQHQHLKAKGVRKEAEADHHAAIHSHAEGFADAGMTNHTDTDVSAIKALLNKP